MGRRWRVVLLAGAGVIVVLLLAVAAESRDLAVELIAGVIAVVSLLLMLFTNVVFGKHERSTKWDEFLHQPPRRPGD